MTDHASPTRGRPRLTNRAEVARAALNLFEARGFDATTMDHVAAEIGIGRRTLFRYFASKNDLVWGDFDWVLDRLRADLAATDAALPAMTAIRRAAVVSNTYPDEALPELRIRMTLITTVPALQAHSMLRYAEWREVVASFAARRTRDAPADFVPQAIGHAALAASTSAFSYWVRHPERNLVKLLDRSYALLESGFDAASLRRRAPR